MFLSSIFLLSTMNRDNVSTIHRLWQSRELREQIVPPKLLKDERPNVSECGQYNKIFNVDFVMRSSLMRP